MAEDGFTQMIDDSNAFFAELSQNNTKAWFDPRKEHYNTHIKKPAELFADLLAEDFSRISGRGHKPKVFRIYRDVRFSKDKTPLNAHLHILWEQGGDNPFAPGFFFASSPSELAVAYGIIGLKGEALTRYRAFVDTWSDALVAAIAETGMEMSDWGPEPLKRVPQPYDADHPHADLLRRKSLLVHAPLGQEWREQKVGLLTAVRKRFEAVQPLGKLMADRLA